MPGTREEMIAQMAALVGTHENNGDNRTKVGAWFGDNGQPWCDQGITYAAYHSGNEQSVCFGQKWEYTVAHADAFKAHGLWHPMTAGVAGSGLRAGDIIFFDWGGTSAIGNIDHVGIVESVSGSVAHTIECNADNQCERVSRTVESIAGFGRPAYRTPPPKPGPKPVPAPKPVTYEPYPGLAWFKTKPKHAIITRMGKRLVARGVGVYTTGPGPQWTDADKTSYARYQRSIGLSGADADGWPGEASWDALKVPKA